MDIYQASKASVEGEAPSGFAGGGGDASPFNRSGIGDLPLVISSYYTMIPLRSLWYTYCNIIQLERRSIYERGNP
ncbi:MAG: hypothetical protein AAB014_01315 [Nitrospirota bacterium]